MRCMDHMILMPSGTDIQSEFVHSISSSCSSSGFFLRLVSLQSILLRQIEEDEFERSEGSHQPDEDVALRTALVVYESSWSFFHRVPKKKKMYRKRRLQLVTLSCYSSFLPILREYSSAVTSVVTVHPGQLA